MGENDFKVTQPLQCDFPKQLHFFEFLLSIFSTCGYHGYQIKMAGTKYCTMFRHTFRMMLYEELLDCYGCIDHSISIISNITCILLISFILVQCTLLYTYLRLLLWNVVFKSNLQKSFTIVITSTLIMMPLKLIDVINLVSMGFET